MLMNFICSTVLALLNCHIVQPVFYTVWTRVSFRNLIMSYSAMWDGNLVIGCLASCWPFLLTYYGNPSDCEDQKGLPNTVLTNTASFNSNVRHGSVTKTFTPAASSLFESKHILPYKEKNAETCTWKNRNNKREANDGKKNCFTPKKAFSCLSRILKYLITLFPKL